MNTGAFVLPRGWLAFSRGDIWNHIVFLAVVVFVFLPLTFLVLGSFSTARLPSDFSLDQMSFKNYLTVWLDPDTFALFYNTFVYVGGSTAFGITLAAVLAYLVERTNMPGKVWLYAGIPMTLAVPGLLQSMAWLLLLSPRAGFINRFWMDDMGFEQALFNINSLEGMVFVEGLRLIPTAFLMLVPLLRSMDPALEEAASVSGATPVATLRRVTLGLMMPGLVAITIFQAMTALEVFEVPGILGMPVGIHVFATKIYAILQTSDVLPKFGEASALGMLYLLIGFAAAFFYWFLVRKSEKFAVVTGKGYRPRPVELGRWRYPALGLVFLFLFLSILLPYLVMLYASLVPFLQSPSIEAFQNMTLKHYASLFTFPKFAQTFWNTIVMVVGVATATTLFSFLISMVVVRTKFWGRRQLDQLAFMPHAIPGIVAGTAFLWVFLVFDLFGSIWTIVIGFTAVFISYGTRVMNAAIMQIHKDLEEAAGVSGAPPWRTMLRVFFPLMRPSFVGLWIWVVLLSIRIAGLPLILLEGPNNQVLAVLIWILWDEGEIETVAAIGVLLMTALFLLVLGLRIVAFGRGAIHMR